jgi:arabinan endo-1,5-alpha-L-arabinosidase
LRALSLGKTDNPTALGTYLTPTWCQPSNPMADGLWHHVTLAVDGAAWWWYIDGQLRYSGTGMDDLPVDLLTLNGRPDGQQYWSLPASYSNLRVYNRPLAEAEARTLFEAGL